MKMLLTGATGFVGGQLLPVLRAAGHEVVVLSRDPGGARGRLSCAVPCHRWIPERGEIDPSALEGVQGVIHLAGESIAVGRWTETRKQRILNSRETGTANLVSVIQELERPPEVFISASAVGYYGNQGNEELTETSASGSDFLAEVCRRWEDAALRAKTTGARVHVLRTGLVFGRGGGALERMLPLFQLGLGARMGSGNQWMSWIHNDDLARLILRLLEGASHEIFNATAPHPVTNAELTSTLARQLKRPAFFRIPGGVLKLALGEMADALLASAKAVPRNALDIGFSFRHPTLGEALSEILGDGCRVLTREQWVPRPREEVFAFFAEAGNLERITPPLVRFRIDPPAPISMGKGTVISYRLGLHGIPFRWVSRIDEWDPPRTFVDLQVRGPYRYWRHRHDFEEKDGGTLLRDTVRYRLPLEPFSRLLVGGRIEKDLTEIFSYRRRAVEELFGGR